MTKLGNRLGAFLWACVFSAIGAGTLYWYSQRFFAGDPMAVLQNLPPLNAAMAFFGLVGVVAGLCLAAIPGVVKKIISGKSIW